MRVTERFRTDELLRNLQAHAWRLSRAYEKLSTQHEIIRPSDDPTGAARIMRLTAHLQSLEQTNESVMTAQSFLTFATDAMERAADTVTRARVLAVQAANGTFSDSERQAIATEVNQLLESLVQMGNEMTEGRYLFSGTKTDTAPFSVVRDADGDIESISYDGSASPLQFPLGRGRQVPVSVLGDVAFIQSGVFQAVISFRDHLENEAGLTEEELAAALQTDLADLAQANKALLSETGQLGSRSTHLDLTGDQTQRAIIRTKETVSRIRDADVAEIAVELQKEEMMFQALLATGARIMSLSLIDYLI